MHYLYNAATQLLRELSKVKSGLLSKRRISETYGQHESVLQNKQNQNLQNSSVPPHPLSFSDSFSLHLFSKWWHMGAKSRFTHLCPRIRINSSLLLLSLWGKSRGQGRKLLRSQMGNTVCAQCLYSAQHNVIWPFSGGCRYIEGTIMDVSSPFAHYHWYATRKAESLEKSRPSSWGNDGRKESKENNARLPAEGLLLTYELEQDAGALFSWSPELGLNF